MPATWSRANTNGSVDIFVHDRQTGVTERASVDSSGNEGNSASAEPSISGDGHFLAFSSYATNLVAGDTNGFIDVFVRDRSCTDAFDSYCTAGISASGCTVQLSSTGVASGTATSGFVVTAPFVEGQKDGQFLYGQNGKQALPWGNGTSFQCVVPPIKRGGLRAGQRHPRGLQRDDQPGPERATGARPVPSPTTRRSRASQLQIQFWYRDPLSTSNQSRSLLRRDRGPALPVVRATGKARPIGAGCREHPRRPASSRFGPSGACQRASARADGELEPVGERRRLVRGVRGVAVPELRLDQGSRAGILGRFGRPDGVQVLREAAVAGAVRVAADEQAGAVDPRRARRGPPDPRSTPGSPGRRGAPAWPLYAAATDSPESP